LAAIMFTDMVGYSAMINSPSRCSKNIANCCGKYFTGFTAPRSKPSADDQLK
jgi:hypothetical protein